MMLPLRATTSAHVDLMLYLFALLYLLLGTSVVLILRKLFRNKPAELELAAETHGGDIR